MKSFPHRLRHASGQWMTLERDRVLVGVKGAQARTEDVLGRLGLVAEEVGDPGAFEENERPQPLNVTPGRKWARSESGAPLSLRELAEKAERLDAVRWLGPVYSLELEGRRELLSPLPHVLLIQPAPEMDDEVFAEKMRGYGLVEDEKRSKYLRPYRYFVVEEPLKVSALELVRQLRENEDLVRSVQLDLMPMYVPTAFVPNDPLYPSQWDMLRIRAGGPGQTGWNLERGDPSIVICVLDEGCDLTHPDLVPYAAPGINLGTMSGDGSPTGNHGTPCAGIAAANTHSGVGVAGVAGGCRVLPVAFQSWSDTEVAAGIRYATDQGARVISMSFGWNAWNPAIIDPAIQEAFDANVVMCVATHNYNSSITYPATNPLVMACGASDQDDERKSPSSPDGEPWGSNYGPQISVVAPGVLCPSTDRQGSAGYNTSGGAAGNYVPDFNGTSAATPHVAGLAALLLSCDPGLSNVEVRNLIEQTADRVGSVPYATLPGYPNGPWNQEMGYGRINVHKALNTVCKKLLFELKMIVLDKHPEEVKWRTFKEKDRIDEVKGRVGYEWDDRFDPSIFEHILKRLEHLERRGGQGRTFIERSERPDVGRQLARGARRTGEPER